MKDMLYFLKQIHHYAGRSLYLNMLAMTVIGLLEGVALLALLAMISMSGIVELDVAPIRFLENFNLQSYIPDFLVLPIILLIYLVVIISYNYTEKVLAIRNVTIQTGFVKYMRTQVYESVIHANWAFFIKNRKTDLVHGILNEVARTTGGISALLQFIASLIFTVIQIVLAFWLSPTITTFIIISGIILVFFNRQFLKKSLALGSKTYENGRLFLAGITDQFNGMKDIKSNSLEENRMKWFYEITDNIQKETIEYSKLKNTSQFYYKVASSVLIALFIFIAINLFQAKAAELMLIIVIFSRLWPRVAGIQGSLEEIASTIPSYNAVLKLQKESLQSQEYAPDAVKNLKRIQLQKGITCTNIHFKYNSQQEHCALKHINLFIPANEMTAVIGRSGAGKSTLIDLLMGLNQPEKGEVLYDGVPLTKDNVVSIRSSLSYVPQDPFLYNATIRENLLLVKSDATDEEMWEALEFAFAATFVGKLKDGLDTLIGDRGVKLSGGERQRVVLARAILRKPSILILDEATSALDTESEAIIQAAIDQLKGRMTIIVIAHRLSTIRNADQVVVLDNGEIIQQGKYQQLSKEKNKLFSTLLEKQRALM